MDRRLLLKGIGAGAVLTAARPAFAQAGSGRWLHLESQNFNYYSTGDSAKATSGLASLEGFHALLGRVMPRSQRSPMKLTVYNTTSQNELKLGSPGASEMIMGFYQSGIEHIRAVTSTRRELDRQRDVTRNARTTDSQVVLFHEYAHHYMRANNRLAYPAWYAEGFAEFLSTAEFGARGVEIGKVSSNRAMWLTMGDWLPIETLLSKHTSQLKTGEEVAQFYAQAWLASHYVFATPERAKGFDRYTQDLLQGGDLLGAFEPAFGISPQKFDQELRDYKRQPIRFWTLPDAKPDDSSIKVQRLAKSTDELLLRMSYLRMLPSREDAADTIAAVREEVRKQPQDVYAMQCKAFVELWYGDLNEARKQIDTLLPLAPTLPDSHHLSGLCDLRAGRKSGDRDVLVRAQESFGAAHQLDGNRPQTMFRYVESGLALGEMDEHLLDVLLRAYLLAPQVDPIAMTAAQALIHHERYDEAVVVLRPMTADLHGGSMPSMARALTDMAMAKQRQSFSFFGAAMLDDE